MALILNKKTIEMDNLVEIFSIAKIYQLQSEVTFIKNQICTLESDIRRLKNRQTVIENQLSRSKTLQLNLKHLKLIWNSKRTSK